MFLCNIGGNFVLGQIGYGGLFLQGQVSQDFLNNPVYFVRVGHYFTAGEKFDEHLNFGGNEVGCISYLKTFLNCISK